MLTSTGDTRTRCHDGNCACTRAGRPVATPAVLTAGRRSGRAGTRQPTRPAEARSGLYTAVWQSAQRLAYRVYADASGGPGDAAANELVQEYARLVYEGEHGRATEALDAVRRRGSLVRAAGLPVPPPVVDRAEAVRASQRKMIRRWRREAEDRYAARAAAARQALTASAQWDRMFDDIHGPGAAARHREMDRMFDDLFGEGAAVRERQMDRLHDSIFGPGTAVERRRQLFAQRLAAARQRRAAAATEQRPEAAAEGLRVIVWV
jgi:hypothetical protein